MNKRRLNGFTLIEILVAIAIFAVLGVAANRLLSQVMRSDEATRERSARLAELQRALGIVERDVMQAAPRGVRDELGSSLPALTGGVNGMLEFTRAGWRNPTRSERSELQRVAYLLEGNQLLRLYWPVLDRAAGSEPIRQVLLTKVSAAEVAFVAADGEARSFWPQDDSGANALPRAVRLHLELAPWGDIDRVFALPDTLPQRIVDDEGRGAPRGPGAGTRTGDADPNADAGTGNGSDNSGSPSP